MSAHRSFSTLFLLGCLLGAVPSAAGILAGNCRLANQPAATLLIPYFEVDLANSGGQSTLFSVNNASAKPVLSRVVLWTDWGVPTLAFDVYLTGYDIQTFNVRDLLNGSLPDTGPQVSNTGTLSNSGTLFTGCSTAGAAGVSPQLAPEDVAWLRAAHTGQPVATSPTAQCAGSGTAGPNVATGYITVDTVNRCSPRTVGTLVNTPANATYFAAKGTGLASDDNVLWGDFTYINPQRNTSNGQSAITLVADPDALTAGTYTFYGRYVGFDGRDNRVPLSSLYYARYVNGGTFSGGTDLIVWRDNRRTAVGTSACGQAPSWSPLGEMQLVTFDEEENPKEIANSNAFPVVTQKVHVGGPSLPISQPFGWLMLDLWHKDSTHAQAWVGVWMTAEGHFSSGAEALRVDDLCNFGP
ncbi:MAG TPA: hypothetical protein VIJ36_09025 [Thermoanaerobaculia bacterium]